MNGPDVPERPRIVVAAAVVEQAGAFLVTRRPHGVHLAGYWEFPGGKCEGSESYADCLVREMKEELDASVRVGREIFTASHAYSDRIVELHFLACTLTGALRPLLGQALRWVRREDLAAQDFPAADAELIRRLQDGSD